MVERLPVVDTILDGLKQRFLAVGAAGASVTGQNGVGNAWFGATTRQVVVQFGHVDDRRVVSLLPIRAGE